jgi:uncharacterized protein YndB with AHSA1/START domain
MKYRIEKQVELKAPVARVWRALTDHEQFGAWFGATVERPFAVGQTARGKVTYPGYEHLTWEAQVTRMEPESVFAFTWHPYALDPKTDYSAETPTLVEFHLQRIPSGTLLRVTETGFENMPAGRRDEAFRMNEQGWAEQMQSIAQYLDAHRP